MKFYNIILFASLFLCTLSEDDNCILKENASSAKDCKDIKTSFYKCCYYKGKLDDEDYSRCIPLLKEQYDDIKATIKEIEKEGGDVKKLDCKSYYLELSLLSFILLLL